MMQPAFIAIVAVTIDGRIARHENDMSTDWTSEEDKLYMRALLKECDAVLVGRSTYEVAYKPLSKRMCMVVTRTVKDLVQENELCVRLNPAHTDIRAFARDRGWKRIAVLGGAQVYGLCFEKQWIDELHLTIEPLIFGDGIPLVQKEGIDARFDLEETKILNSKGTVVLRYRTR